MLLSRVRKSSESAPIKHLLSKLNAAPPIDKTFNLSSSTDFAGRNQRHRLIIGERRSLDVRLRDVRGLLNTVDVPRDPFRRRPRRVINETEFHVRVSDPCVRTGKVDCLRLTLGLVNAVKRVTVRVIGMETEIRKRTKSRIVIWACML